MEGETGVITADMIKKALPDYKENVFYTCGPPPMVKAMETIIESLGLPKKPDESRSILRDTREIQINKAVKRC